MLLTPGQLPAEDARYLFEVKYDGWRCIAYVDRGTMRLVSRRGNDVTERAGAAVAQLARSVSRHRLVLDGELIAIHEDGRPDFERLHVRTHGTAGRQPVLMLFDLLWADGVSVLTSPLEERKRQLGELELNGEAWRTVSYSVGNGPALLAASREQQLEGLVAKRLGSKYRPGRRSPDWIKIQNFERRELVIGGWITHASGTRGILVGEFDGEKLQFAGIVDNGVEPQLIAALENIEQAHSPFAAGPLPRGVRYVQPRVVVDVQYLAGANSLRHSRLRSVRIAE